MSGRRGGAGKIRAGVAGCGAFGRHHARVYRELGALEGVYDTDRGRAEAVAREHEARVFGSLEELAGACQAASVATPTATHAEAGVALLEAGCHVLVEKPIAPTLAEADRLAAAARAAGRVLQAGHLERFNPAVQAVRARVTRPLFFEVHRLSPFTPRSLDVDVLLDLMIHDLDLVLMLAGGEIAEIRGVGLPVLTAQVDIANVRLALDNGCVANLTASRVSTERVRKLRFFQPGEYVSLDYARQDAHIFSLQGAAAMPGGGGREAGFDPARRIAHQHLTPPQQEPLRLELEHFLACVQTGAEPEANAAVARRALAAALAAAAAIREHARRVGVGKN